MHKGDTIPGLLSLLFGALFVGATYVNPQLTAVSKTSDGVPGAGFFPYLLGGGIILLGLALLVRGIRQNGSVQYIILSEEGVENVKILVKAILGLIVALVIWKVGLPFIIVVLALSLYMNWIFGRTKKFNIIYSGVFTAFVYVAFYLGFSIQFVA